MVAKNSNNEYFKWQHTCPVFQLQQPLSRITQYLINKIRLVKVKYMNLLNMDEKEVVGN